MSDNSNNDFGNQNIDLSQISKKIGSISENIATRIFRGILFLKKNLLVIGVLFMLGAGLGLYLDRTSKSYSDEIIVLPNFGSTDYLYSKIRLIESKIKENDTVFLNETIGVKNAKKLKSITIAPIPDIYKFINSSKSTNDKNFEVLKLMVESADFKKIIKDDLTSKNFQYHTIIIETHNKVDYKTVVEPILKYLNNSAYFSQLQKVYLNNTKIKVAQNDSIIADIDGFLNSFSSKSGSSQKNDKLIYYNENSQLNDVIKTKDELNIEQGKLRVDLANYDKIVKDVTVTTNIRIINGADSKMKFLLPVLFVFLFLLGEFIRSFYRRQMIKLNQHS